MLGAVSTACALSQSPARHGEHSVLVTPDKLLKRLLALCLRPATQFAVVRRASRPGDAPPCGCHRGGRVQRLYFWDARHKHLVTAMISGLPEPVSIVSLPLQQLCTC